MLEVKISDSITDLKDNAFSDCVNLQNIILNKGLKNIGDSAFKNTTKLSSITCYSKTVPLLADNVFSNIQHNGILTVPEDVNYLPWLINEPGYLGAYDWSVSYIPETKLLLDGYDVVAIFKADNATGSTKLWNNRNNDVTEMSIDGQPVDVVTQYNFNDTNEHIVRYRFKNEGSVPNFCFSACTQMYECKIAEGITIIGMYGFDYCRKLNHLVLPNTLQACGTWAFNSVKSLEIITFGENFRGIGDYGLDQNFALKYIICYAATAPKLDYNVFNYIYQNGTLFYPKGADYSSWMSKSIGYLGNNKWKSKEFDKIITEEGE
jgi:hypothetical protein